MGLSQKEIRAAITAGQARFPGARSSRSKTSSPSTPPDPEEALHRACHQWNELHEARHPILKWMFHCPNGGGRSKAEAGRLKAMGVRPGVPDFVLPFPSPSGKWPGCAVELKSPDGKLTQKQREWLQHAHIMGWAIGIARDVDTYISLATTFINGVDLQSIPGEEEIFRKQPQ